MSISVPPTEEFRFLEVREPILRIISWADATYTIHVRGYTKHGLFIVEHKTNSDRSRKDEDYRLPDLPVGVRVHSPSPPSERGRLFARLELFMGGANAQTLCGGYITRHHTLTWPPGQIEHSVEGPGYTKRLTGTNPAAGNEISESVPANARWRLKSIAFKFATDLTVATRRVSLIVDDGLTVILQVNAATSQSADASNYYAFIAGFGRSEYAAGGRIYIPLPPNIILLSGWRVRTSTSNLQAGDDYGAPELYVEEWLED